MYFTSFLGQFRWLWQKLQNCQSYRCKAGSADARQERFTRNKSRKWLIKGMDITMVTVTDSNLSEQESKGTKPRKTCWLLLTKIRLYFIVHSIHALLTLCFLIFNYFFYKYVFLSLASSIRMSVTQFLST